MTPGQVADGGATDYWLDAGSLLQISGLLLIAVYVIYEPAYNADQKRH